MPFNSSFLLVLATIWTASGQRPKTVLYDWIPEIIGKLKNRTSCCGMNDFSRSIKRVKISCTSGLVRTGQNGRITELQLSDFGPRLSGPIPSSLGEFWWLRSLILDMNSLTVFPVSLANEIILLETLNLRRNSFSANKDEVLRFHSSLTSCELENSGLCRSSSSLLIPKSCHDSTPYLFSYSI
jgi:hypothetical protein